MTSLKRVFLFAITNLAVVMVLGIVLRVLGVDQMLASRGIGVSSLGLLVFAAAFGFGGSFISLALSKTIAKWSTGARVITAPRTEVEVWLLETVHRHAQRAGIDMPEVAVYDAPEMNAFATGMFRNRSLVAVSTGLLASMRREEVEAVLGHEIAHVANGDMVTLALLQGVVNTFVIFISRLVGWIVDRVVLRNERGLGIGYWVTVIAMEMVLGVLATMIVMWFSRRREFRADRGGAELAGRDPMISALARLGTAHGPGQLPESIKAFGIRGGAPGWLRLFSSHPPIEQRIAALSASAR